MNGYPHICVVYPSVNRFQFNGLPTHVSQVVRVLATPSSFKQVRTYSYTQEVDFVQATLSYARVYF